MVVVSLSWRPPSHIPLGLQLDCSNDTRFVSLVEMSFTDPHGGLKSWLFSSFFSSFLLLCVGVPIVYYLHWGCPRMRRFYVCVAQEAGFVRSKTALGKTSLLLVDYATIYESVLATVPCTKT